MTQTDRLLHALRYKPVCSMELLDWQPRITRGAARILELRAEGHDIATSICKLHDHPTARHARYDLVTADQGALF